MNQLFRKSASVLGSLLLSLMVACPNTTPATPDFSLTLGSPSVSIKRTQAGTVTVSLTKTGGFQDSVSLTLENAPAGVTGSFTPASTTSSSTLNLNVALAAALGDTNLTVKGVSGTLTKTATFKLTVTAAPTSGDTTAPFVLSTTANTNTSVTVVFSEQINGGNVAANFSFPGGQGLSVTAASIGANGTTVSLTTSAQTANTPYGLFVSTNITDLAGNPYLFPNSSEGPLARNFDGHN